MAHIPFSEVLKTAQEGKFDNDLTLAQQKVVEAVRRTHKAGSVTVTFKFQEAYDQIAMSCDIREKIPTVARQAALFFPDEDGNLHRKNQQQRELAGLFAGGKEPAE